GSAPAGVEGLPARPRPVLPVRVRPSELAEEVPQRGVPGDRHGPCPLVQPGWDAGTEPQRQPGAEPAGGGTETQPPVGAGETARRRVGEVPADRGARAAGIELPSGVEERAVARGVRGGTGTRRQTRQRCDRRGGPWCDDHGRAQRWADVELSPTVGEGAGEAA